MQEINGRAMRRWTMRVAAAGLLVAGTLAWSAGTGGATDKTLRTEGGEQFQADVKISSNLRWSPSQTVVRSGDTLHLVHADSTTEPHTLSIVNADEVPATSDDVFNCGSPGTICDQVFQAVVPQINDQSQAQFVNVAGGAGLDGRLDTAYLPAGTSLDVVVTAPPGTTLSFMCVIHAWMQGTITVS